MKLNDLQDSIIWHKCTVGSCLRTFDEPGQRDLHEATDWHCRLCGRSAGYEVTLDNGDVLCYICEETKYGNR